MDREWNTVWLNKEKVEMRIAWLLVGLILVGCGGEPAQQAPSPAPVAVQVAAVEKVQMPVVVGVVGTTRPRARALPGTRLMGRVAAVLADEGDRVERGQVLARLESGDLKARRQQAEAALTEARAVLVHADKDRQRLGNLLKERATTQQQVDASEMQYARARAGVESAEQGVREAKEQLRYAAVRSPLDGVVVQRSVETGDMAGPGTPLFVVEQLDTLKIVLAVGERDLQAVQVGGPVEVEIPALDKRLAGRVAAVVPAADPASRSFGVEVLAANTDGAVGSGMFARVQLEKGRRPGLVMPAAAVVKYGQLQGAYALVDGRLRLRWLRLGQRRGDGVEVLSGLRAGDRVVVAGTAKLKDGMPAEAVGNG